MVLVEQATRTRRAPCTVCGGPKPPGRGRSRCDGCADAPYPSEARVSEKTCPRCRRVRPIDDYAPLASPRPRAVKERRLCCDCVGTRPRSAPTPQRCQCGAPKRPGRGQRYCDECFVVENAKAAKLLLVRKLVAYSDASELYNDRSRMHRARAMLRAAGFDAAVEFVRRSVVWQRDEGVCGICGVAADPDDWHLDHVVSLSRGGSHTYANTQVSHPPCNVRKGAGL